MNKQLQELAEQATEVKWLHDGQYALVMPEKFAELIVKECARQVKDDDNAYDILKHFGVEE